MPAHPPSVDVRPATGPDEFPALVRIWRSAVEATHDFLTPADVDGYVAPILDDYLPALEVLVATVDDEPVGFVALDGDQVEMLFVDAARHGQGIGSVLMGHVVARHPAVTVDVNEQNPGALAFYRRQGFEVVGRSPLDGEGRPFPLLHLRRG